MTVNGYTRTCGLFGNPVEHTMSPAIHNTLAEELGLNLVYVPFHVNTGFVEEAVKAIPALNLLGCNVTIPYKSQVIPYLDEVDELAAKIGAVNTIVPTDKGLKGYNTDMPGLYRAMCEDGFLVDDSKVLLLGAGGVSRAVALLLGEYGAEEVIILNRTVERAVELAEEVNTLTGRTFARALALSDYDKLEGNGYLCIQATNVGMFPNIEQAVIEDERFYNRISAGYDLVYNPTETKFMKLLKAQGKPAYNGMKMLLYQGIIAFELWTGIDVPKEASEKAYKAMKTAMKVVD